MDKLRCNKCGSTNVNIQEDEYVGEWSYRVSLCDDCHTQTTNYYGYINFFKNFSQEIQEESAA